jgi:hypothetical protein
MYQINKLNVYLRGEVATLPLCYQVTTYSFDNIGINVPLVSEINVPPSAERNVPLVSD